MISMSGLQIYMSRNSYNFFLTHMEATDRSNNSDYTKLLCDTTPPFEMLIDQIKECIEFADAGSLLFTAAQIFNMAYNLVFNMGLVSLMIVRSGMHDLTMKKHGTILKLISYKPKMNCGYNNKLSKPLAMHLENCLCLCL